MFHILVWLVCAQVLYADEISTGLDSNTTHQITKSLRDYCHVMHVRARVGGGVGMRLCACACLRSVEQPAGASWLAVG